MSNYIFAFHGGKMPDTPEEGVKAMEKWKAWMGGLGAALVDPGGPVGMSSTVSASGVAGNGGANPLSGYTVVQADSKDAAIKLTEGCPILENEGTIEVVEVIDM